METYDVCIVGAGPAGMAAAIYSARKALSTIMLETKSAGGYMALAPWIENYPGVEKVAGMELAERMRKQAEGFGIDSRTESAIEVARKKDGFLVKTSDNEYAARTVILATGCNYSRLGIPGESEFLGKGVSYCATCDGPFFSGKRVAVVGGGNTALSSAILMCDIASEVYLVHRREQFRGDEMLQKRLGKTKPMLCRVPTRIIGNQFVTGIELEDVGTKKKTILPIDGVFVNIGALPNSSLAKSIGAHLDEKGHIRTDPNGATSVPGLFAAGDVTGGIRQVVIATGQGAAAATGAYDYIKYGRSIKEE